LGECQSLASKIQENQIHFYTPWPVEDTDSVYSAADMLILPTRGAQAFASVPSKLIAYMLSQKPIVAISKSGSDLSNFILESGSGWNFEPDQPEKLADEIVKISGMDTSVLVGLGKNAREYAMRNMTAQVCLPKIIQLLET
jgi:glycosyltransferase involved in cell wall biosynthesis